MHMIGRGSRFWIGTNLFLFIVTLFVGCLSSRVLATEIDVQQEQDPKQDAVFSEESTETQAEEPLSFEDEGRSGIQVAGDSRSSCPQSYPYLSAITAKNGLSKTYSTHPRWWFHFPFASSNIQHIEFSLKKENSKEQPGFRKDIAVSQIGNYFGFKLPEDELGLEANEEYTWYLKLFCTPNAKSVPIYVTGKVQRVINKNKASGRNEIGFLEPLEFAERDLWLDAVDSLLSPKFLAGSEQHCQESWRRIIYSPEIDLPLTLEETNNPKN